ncbi:MAG: hypothetical protein ACM31C_32845 [Acidobacteriota bacterium]
MVRPLLDNAGMNKLAVAFVLAAVTGGTAVAEPVLSPPSLTEPAPAPVKQTEWYGWQILAADGATFALAAGTEHGEIAFGWIGTGAAIHAAHHNYTRSLLSVGLRVGLPILGASVGAANSQGCTGDLCGLGDVLVGGMVGMGAAEIADLVLATDEREVAPVPTRSWTPVASVRHSGATFGIAARF